MDDPFGCLRGVESVEHDLYKLTSEMVEKKFNELPRINYCPSCEVHLVNVMNEFCRECPKCNRVFECDEQLFQEENLRRSTASPTPPSHLKNSLRKWEIYEMFSFNQISFLGNVIAQFQAKTGKSVNYACFLHNYFEMVPSECWPQKRKLWNLFLITFLKPLQAGGTQNRSLKNGGGQTIKVLHTHFHICQFLDFSPNA